MTLRGRFFTIKLVIRSLPGDFFYYIVYFFGGCGFGRQRHWERRFEEVFNYFQLSGTGLNIMRTEAVF